MTGWRERLRVRAAGGSVGGTALNQPDPETISEAGAASTTAEQQDAADNTFAGLPGPPAPTEDDQEPADPPIMPPPGLLPPEQPMILGRRRSVVGSSILFTLGAGVAYVLFRAISELYTVLVLLALSLLIALTLNPLVEFLQRGRLPRWLAALLAWLLAGGLLATPVVLAVKAASSQLPKLVANVPTLISNAESHLGPLGDRIRSATSGGNGSKLTPEGIVDYVLQGGTVIFDAVGGVFIVGALTLWLLIGLPRLVEFILLLVPATRRDTTRRVTADVLNQISRQMMASVGVALLAGLATFAWTAAVGVPYPVLLGSLVAILDLVPTIGSTIGGVIVTLIALTVSFPVALFTLGFYIAFRMVEDYVILPRAMRFSVELPGVVTVPAVLVGGAVLGLPGALFAVPVTLVVRVLVRDLAMPALDKR